MDVALGSDGKSLDFTAVDGQVNNIVLPSSGTSSVVRTPFTTYDDMVSNRHTGDIIIASALRFKGGTVDLTLFQFSGTVIEYGNERHINGLAQSSSVSKLDSPIVVSLKLSNSQNYSDKYFSLLARSGLTAIGDAYSIDYEESMNFTASEAYYISFS